MIQRIDIHNHSRYSNIRMRDALPAPEQLVDRAIELGLAGIALTDHEVLSGHPQISMYGDKIHEKYPDFKIILGNEIYLVDERPSDVHYHYILLAKDSIGHHQLRELSSLAWLNSYTTKGMTRVDTLKSDLERVVLSNPGHLISSNACIGSQIGQQLLEMTKAEKANDMDARKTAYDKIIKFVMWNKKLFGEDFYLECQPGISKEQICVNKRIRSMSKVFNIKLIPTSDTHYLKKEDRFVHKAYLNSEEKEREVDSFYQDTYLHSNEEMIEKLGKSDYEEEFVLELFNNTMEIYNKIENYSLLHSQQIPNVNIEQIPKKEAPPDLKDYPVMSNMYNSDDNFDRYWINKCIDKLRDINKFNKEYLDELEEEADVKTIIGKKLNTNMFRYPILLSHYIDLFWECGSTVGIGRGSACSALNHYCLGITQLDPIKWSFPFFR